MLCNSSWPRDLARAWKVWSREVTIPDVCYNYFMLPMLFLSSLSICVCLCKKSRSFCLPLPFYLIQHNRIFWFDFTLDTCIIWYFSLSFIYYTRTAENDMKISLIIAVMHSLSSLKKIQALTGFEPMTTAIPVQCSTNWAIKPTGSWPLREFVRYP